MLTEDEKKRGIIIEDVGLTIRIQWVIYYFKKVRVLHRRGETRRNSRVAMMNDHL